jgi:S1-C subfamily serine protease
MNTRFSVILRQSLALAATTLLAASVTAADIHRPNRSNRPSTPGTNTARSSRTPDIPKVPNFQSGRADRAQRITPQGIQLGQNRGGAPQPNNGNRMFQPQQGDQKKQVNPKDGEKPQDNPPDEQAAPETPPPAKKAPPTVDFLDTFGAKLEGTPQGVKVIELKAGSFADKLGLVVGDIISEIKERNVSSLDHARRVIMDLNLSAELKMQVIRRGEPLDLNFSPTM